MANEALQGFFLGLRSSLNRIGDKKRCPLPSGDKNSWLSFTLESLEDSTPWKFNSSPLKISHPKRKVIFQASFFRGELLNFGGVPRCSSPSSWDWPKAQKGIALHCCKLCNHNCQFVELVRLWLYSSTWSLLARLWISLGPTSLTIWSCLLETVQWQGANCRTGNIYPDKTFGSTKMLQPRPRLVTYADSSGFSRSSRSFSMQDLHFSQWNSSQHMFQKFQLFSNLAVL